MIKTKFVDKSNEQKPAILEGTYKRHELQRVRVQELEVQLQSFINTSERDRARSRRRRNQLRVERRERLQYKRIKSGMKNIISYLVFQLQNTCISNCL